MTEALSGVALPFTRHGYRALLSCATRFRYAFRGFDDPHRDEGARICLLRHDVDVDLGAAVELAQIEAAMGVKATYFVMLRSAFYNLFSRANQELVHELCRLGHDIGLHFDAAYTSAASPVRTPGEAIELEARVLEEILGTRVGSVSFHQPSLGPDPGEIRPRGIVSAWNVPGYVYISDANKSDVLLGTKEVFASGRHTHVQLLVHPIWWATEDPDASTTERFDAAIRANFERTQAQALATERAFGRPRRFVIEPGSDA